MTQSSQPCQGDIVAEVCLDPATMSVAYRRRERVGRISRWRAIELQQRHHHVLDLVLGRRARAYHGKFDLSW
jgi:hypothetical protein